MRWLTILVGLVAAAAFVAAGCRPTKTVISPGDHTEQTQWEQGVWLYGQHCAGCHGDNGEGTNEEGDEDDAPAIAGDGALPREPSGEGSERKATFDNAADIFGYVKQEMPPLAPGSLSDDNYWSILVYVLKQAQIKVPAADLSPANAASVKLR